MDFPEGACIDGNLPINAGSPTRSTALDRTNPGPTVARLSRGAPLSDVTDAAAARGTIRAMTPSCVVRAGFDDLMLDFVLALDTRGHRASCFVISSTRASNVVHRQAARPPSRPLDP